jgi:hypothetical protein
MQNCPAAEQKKLLWSLQMVLLSNFSSNDLQQLTQLYLPGKKNKFHYKLHLFTAKGK